MSFAEKQQVDEDRWAGMIKEVGRLKKLVEAAFLEGHREGYSSGQSDQCAYDWGSGGTSSSAEEAWEESDAREELLKTRRG